VDQVAVELNAKLAQSLAQALEAQAEALVFQCPKVFQAVKVFAFRQKLAVVVEQEVVGSDSLLFPVLAE
jgi:hypothetical protein